MGERTGSEDCAVGYTVSKVLNSNPDSLSTAAAEAGAGATRVGEDMATQRKHLQTLDTDWVGTAADAAQKQGTDMLTDQAAYKTKLEDLKTELSKGADSLTGIRSDLRRAVDDAEVWWDVDDDGSVQPGWALSAYAALSTANWFDVETRRVAVEQAIKLILAQFEAADDHTASEVRKLGWK
jgi:hypothetical protein